MTEEVKNPPQQEDLLEQLLAGAAQKAAQAETAKLEAKGAVTKSEFSTALGEFKASMLTAITEAITASKATPEPEPEAEPEEVVAKGAGRKGTIPGSSTPDARESNPISYVVRKSRTKTEAGRPGYESFDPTDKAIVWALTMKGLTQGMSLDTPENDVDFSKFDAEN